MKPENWKQLDRLFHEALTLPPDERNVFINNACGGDDSLRHQVEALLSAHGKAGSFIEKPALEVEARSIAKDQTESAVGQTIGHYKIISQLGVGGMGEVYLAEDTSLGRKVAIKLLPVDFTRDDDRVRRFQQEARAASALNHPNIITIFEIGEVESRHFLATEFIDGHTLRQHIGGSQTTDADKSRTREQLKVNEILNIAIQIADALAAAHEAGIVHRDIKPENIMLRRRDSYVKVLDFGLAKLTDAANTSVDPEAPTKAQVKTGAGIVMGTPSYMSPEQARGATIDARTDVWSLGVVIYELVAGCPPFERSTPSEVIALILEREPPPLLRYARDIPAELERIVSKALTKDKEERYQTAKDLLVDLRRLKQRLDVEADIERNSQGREFVGN
jgi:serine/threonine protein kinase